MPGGNSTAVAGWGIDRRRIRDRVDGGDKEQQANQPDGIFQFQRVPESEAASHPGGRPIMGSNIVYSVQELRELSCGRTGSGFRPPDLRASPRGPDFLRMGIARSCDDLPRNPLKRAGKAERRGPL